MGNLVFQATLGGQVNLVGPNTASTFNLNVPAVAGTLVTTGDTGTVTNTMLAGSIANAKLSNSSVTIGGTSIALGASSSTITNDLSISGLTVGKGAGAVSTNTAVGASALAANTSGAAGVAIGYQALQSNTTASRNTAVGFVAGNANTTGHITALGAYALYANTTGSGNTALGGNDESIAAALQANTTGSSNTAVGTGALTSNTTASYNTAVGYQAGYSVTTAGGVGYNAFFGSLAGQATTGSINCFIGGGAGSVVTTGSKNTILGSYNGNQGGLDIRTSSNNIVISDGDGTPYLFWKSASLTWFFGQLASGAGTNALKWNTTTGAITYDTSSLRYKDNVRDSIYGLSHVMQMRSAQFEYKDDGRSDIGLIAEELQPIIPELVGVNKEGQADSVSYDRLVSVLIKAVQELKAEFDAYKEAHP